MIREDFESGSYPVGAEHDPRAPWNSEDQKPVEIEVTVSLTISKTVRIEVDDYKEDKSIDDEGMPCVDYDFSECDLKEAVKQQIYLPEDSKDFNDWTTDDFEVVME